MGIISGVSGFFGLDIGYNNLRLTQLQGSGPMKALVRYGELSIDPKVTLSSTPEAQQKLGLYLRKAIDDIGISTINVVLGLPADQVFTSVVEFDDLRDSELTKNVKFQASTIIPTPIESSKVDWVKLGPSAKNKNKVEVLINSINNRFIENRLDALEGIGLKAVAFEPSTVALSRAVTIPGNDRPQIIINIDYNSTEILAIFKSSPRLTRQVATSIKAMIKSMVNGLNIDQNRAEQYLYGLGLTSESDAHGQVARSIKVDLNAIKSEVKKTIDYFKNRYLNENVEKIILTGPGSRINGLAHHLANHFQLQTEIGNAWNNVIYDQQQESNLMFSSATMAVSVGLAERQE